MTHSDGGKGDKQRPTNKEAYDKHYDEIFRKPREQVKCDRCGKEFWLRADEPHIHTCTPQHTTK